MRLPLLLSFPTLVVLSAGLVALPPPAPGAQVGERPAAMAVAERAVRADLAVTGRAVPGTVQAPAARPTPAPLAGPARPAAADSASALRGRWVWPLAPRPAVARPFVRPATSYAAGHRGVDLVATPGQPVLAVETGTVTHVGRIAGRGTVTLLHPSGVRSTYQPVDSSVGVGDAVARGSRLGRLARTGFHCEPGCLHLGAVRGRTYLDPLVFLGGVLPVRLLPLAQVPDG